MENFSLVATQRTSGKLATIRANAKIPAVMYGHGIEASALEIDYSMFLKTYRKSGKTHLIELSIDGKMTNVLVHEVQLHPVMDTILHVDFFAVNMKEKIAVEIPLEITGNSSAVAVHNALIEQTLHTLEVKCLAKDLVDSFAVDITALKELGDIIHVRDLGIDTKKFDILAPLDQAVVIAQAPKRIEEETATPVTVDQVATVADEKKAERDAAKDAK